MSDSSRSDVRPKSLEELEGVELGSPSVDSYLVRTIHRLHKQPIGEFTVEDLRIMIGQGRGLPFLVPLALDVLELDPFAEGDFYEGDLLKAALSVDSAFWLEYRPELQRVSDISAGSLRELDALDTTDEIRNELRIAAERLLRLSAAAV